MIQIQYCNIMLWNWVCWPLASMMQLIKLCHTFQHFCINSHSCPVHEIPKFWSQLLQCAVPESVTIGLGPVFWLSPEPQPELWQWRYPHYHSTKASTFQKLCVLVCKGPHCLVFRPKIQFQDASRFRGRTSRWKCSQTTSATVPQMPCLSRNIHFVWKSRHSSLQDTVHYYCR